MVASYLFFMLCCPLHGRLTDCKGIQWRHGYKALLLLRELILLGPPAAVALAIDLLPIIKTLCRYKSGLPPGAGSGSGEFIRSGARHHILPLLVDLRKLRRLRIVSRLESPLQKLLQETPIQRVSLTLPLQCEAHINDQESHMRRLEKENISHGTVKLKSASIPEFDILHGLLRPAMSLTTVLAHVNVPFGMPQATGSLDEKQQRGSTSTGPLLDVGIVDQIPYASSCVQTSKVTAGRALDNLNYYSKENAALSRDLFDFEKAVQEDCAHFNEPKSPSAVDSTTFLETCTTEGQKNHLGPFVNILCGKTDGFSGFHEFDPPKSTMECQLENECRVSTSESFETDSISFAFDSSSLSAVSLLSDEDKSRRVSSKIEFGGENCASCSNNGNSSFVKKTMVSPLILARNDEAGRSQIHEISRPSVLEFCTIDDLSSNTAVKISCNEGSEHGPQLNSDSREPMAGALQRKLAISSMGPYRQT